MEKLSNSKFENFKANELPNMDNIKGGQMQSIATAGGSKELMDGSCVEWDSDCRDSEGTHYYGMKWA